MYPSRSPCHYHKNAGLALPAAIFIITILALLTAAMGRLRESEAISYGQAINSTRAFYAAESAAEISIYKLLTSNSCIDESLTLLAFSQCTTNSRCASNTSIFTITVTAICGAGIDQASRIIEVRVK